MTLYQVGAKGQAPKVCSGSVCVGGGGGLLRCMSLGRTVGLVQKPESVLTIILSRG